MYTVFDVRSLYQIHIDYVMEKLNVPLGDLDSFMHKHFYEASNGRWDGSVHVVCDVDRLNETNLKLIEHPKLVGAFGVHPHEAKHWNKDIENNLIGWMKHPKMVLYPCKSPPKQFTNSTHYLDDSVLGVKLD